MSTISTTIPKHYYLDTEIFEAEKERIFYRWWQCVGHVCELPEPGSFFTTSLVDEPLIVVRDEDDALRAFYNVCQHRAHVLAADRGHCDRFVCPYHGWTYDLAGHLIGARGTATVAGFEKRAVKLRQVRLETFCGLIFVNLDDDAAPLRDALGSIDEEILATKPAIAAMEMAAEHVMQHACNWKISVENFSECYHCPVVHRYLVANSYSAEDYRITFDGPIIRHISKGHRDASEHGEHLLIWYVWPNLAIEIVPIHHAVSIRHFRPVSLERADYVYRWYTDPGLAPARRQEVVDYARTHHETTGREDDRLVEQVQRGLRSRGYRTGPLVVTPEIGNESENAVAHVQALYLDALGEV